MTSTTSRRTESSPLKNMIVADPAMADEGLRESQSGPLERLLADSMRALESLVAWDIAALLGLEGGTLRIRKLSGAHPGLEVENQIVALEEAPECREACERGYPVSFTREESDLVDPQFGLPRGRHGLVVPLLGATAIQGVLLLERQGEKSWSTGVIELLDVFGRLLGAAMESDRDSARSSAERDRAEARTRMLEAQGSATERLAVQVSAPMQFVRESAMRMARGEAPILITGEPGVGKEVLARGVHAWSTRESAPFVVFACGAHPAQEHEALLFGEESGLLGLASGGTLLVDDIERLAPAAQGKLLEALQLGSDARVIAGSAADLVERVRKRALLEPLYYLLSASTLNLPPLRARREDVAAIAAGYLNELAEETGGGPYELAPRTLRWLERQDWPGNIRELVNVLDRATILSADPVLEFDSDPMSGVPPLQRGHDGISSLREVEKRHIERVLRATGGQIYGARGAAALLEINPNTLRSRMKKLGLGGARSFRQSFHADD